jgi:hypothetical protein
MRGQQQICEEKADLIFFLVHKNLISFGTYTSMRYGSFLLTETIYLIIVDHGVPESMKLNLEG